MAPTEAEAKEPAGPFAEWLKAERRLRGWSRADLAAMSGVSTMQIGNLENRMTVNPHRRTRERLARALDIDVPAAVAGDAAREASAQEFESLIDFAPYDRESLPMGAGVYVFYDSSGRPVYVGMAPRRPIRDQVREHSEKSWFKKPIVNRASCIEIQDENLCAQVGQVLLRFLKSNVGLTQRLLDQRS